MSVGVVASSHPRFKAPPWNNSDHVGVRDRDVGVVRSDGDCGGGSVVSFKLSRLIVGGRALRNGWLILCASQVVPTNPLQVLSWASGGRLAHVLYDCKATATTPRDINPMC